jgi:hypothetical protein
LVARLIAEAEAEQKLLVLLADAVKRSNRDDVFLIATQLTKTFLAVSGHQQKEKQK